MIFYVCDYSTIVCLPFVFPIYLYISIYIYVVYLFIYISIYMWFICLFGWNNWTLYSNEQNKQSIEPSRGLAGGRNLAFPRVFSSVN